MVKQMDQQKPTILLTGATGFLGSHILKAIINDYSVIILKRSFSDVAKINNQLALVNILRFR